MTATVDFVVSAPGKVIISGEHAVVHGSVAVATVIDKRTYVRVRQRPDGSADKEQAVQLVIQHQQLQHRLSWTFDEIRRCQVAHHLHQASIQLSNGHSTLTYDNAGVQRIAAMKEDVSTPGALCTLPHYSTTPAISLFLLYLVCIIDVRRMSTSFAVEVTSYLPMGSGLGSSASYCTALAAALLHLQRLAAPQDSTDCTCTPAPGDFCQHLKHIINFYALEGEKLTHGNPSGVDNTCSVYGGVIAYQRGREFQVLSNIPALRILISNTGVEKNTKQLVAGVNNLLLQFPAVTQPIFTAINAISDSVLQLLRLEPASQSDEHQSPGTAPPQLELVGQLATLFRLNQHLLNALGVGHAAIDRIVQQTRDSHSLSSKLTGAGGGGCVITLLPVNMSATDVDHLKQQLRATCGVTDCFETIIGQDGVRLEDVN